MSTHLARIARRNLPVVVGAMLAGATAAAPAASSGPEAEHAHHGMMQHAMPQQQRHAGHEHHAEMMKTQGYLRTEVTYEVPDVMLTNQDGGRVSLRTLLAGPRPVMLNYIYTSCTTICPVLSASFAQTQKAFGEEARDIRMVSISIDPEHDTPARLRDYAQRFDAGEGWELLTGSLADIVAVQKAFDAYRGNKASHIPLTFIRAGAGDRWIRLQGFASAGELVREYRSLASSSASSAAGAGRG